MTGPVTARDADAVSGEGGGEHGPTLEVTEGRATTIGSLPIRRGLPLRARRTVGAWCFLDHMGPVDVAAFGPGIAPHPHIGLQTVTWLVSGEQLHRDSLGSEQTIRPGQLNLMTAGHGVAHSEERIDSARDPLHGVQLWVAQPAATRDGPPAFEHHATLPQAEFGPIQVTTLVGSVGGATSPARHDTELVGAQLSLRGSGDLPLDPHYEHALVVLDGAVDIAGRRIGPGQLAYLGTGRDELTLTADDGATLMLIGGTPFEEQVVMWWNYVARSRDEIVAAHEQWTTRDERFAPVASALPPIDVPPPPWQATVTPEEAP